MLTCRDAPAGGEQCSSTRATRCDYHFCPPGRRLGVQELATPGGGEAVVSSVLSLQACLPPPLS